MSKVIWKVPLDPIMVQMVKVPYGARFLSVKEQGNGVSLWFICDPESPKVERTILTMVTGTEFDDELGDYLGTVVLQAGQFVAHIFEAKTQHH